MDLSSLAATVVTHRTVDGKFWIGASFLLVLPHTYAIPVFTEVSVYVTRGLPTTTQNPPRRV